MPAQNEGVKSQIGTRAVAVNYLLEKWVDNKRAATVTLPIVESYSRQRSPTMRRRWPLKGLPYREHNGQRQQTITLSGTTGYQKRDGTDRNGTPTRASGRELFAEFEAFIDKYLEEAEKYAGTTSRNSNLEPRLVFRALRERDAFYVEVLNFTPSGSVNNNNLTLGWSLVLITDGPFVMPKDPETTAPSLAETREREDLKLGDALESVGSDSRFGATQDAVDRVYGSRVDGTTRDRLDGISSRSGLDGARVTDLDAELRQLDPRLNSIRSPVLALTNAVRKSQETIGSLRRLQQAPINVINDIGDLARTTNEALFDLFDALPMVDRQELRRQFTRITSEIDRIELNATSWLGHRGARRAEVSGAGGQRPSPPVAGFVANNVQVVLATLIRNESIEDFAQRVLGSSERWGQIADLNGMISSWQLADGSPIGPGTQLFVPDEGGVEMRSSRSLYGTDLKWRINGTLVWRDGDWALVRGVSNLHQGIVRRLTVKRRSNKTFPRLGLEPIVGRKVLPQLAPMVAGDIQAQMVADDRIKSVSELLVSLKGDQVFAEFTINAVTGEEVAVAAPFPAAG